MYLKKSKLQHLYLRHTRFSNSAWEKESFNVLKNNLYRRVNMYFLVALRITHTSIMKILYNTQDVWGFGYKMRVGNIFVHLTNF